MVELLFRQRSFVHNQFLDLVETTHGVGVLRVGRPKECAALPEVDLHIVLKRTGLHTELVVHPRHDSAEDVLLEDGVRLSRN